MCVCKFEQLVSCGQDAVFSLPSVQWHSQLLVISVVTAGVASMSMFESFAMLTK